MLFHYICTGVSSFSIFCWTISSNGGTIMTYYLLDITTVLFPGLSIDWGIYPVFWFRLFLVYFGTIHFSFFCWLWFLFLFCFRLFVGIHWRVFLLSFSLLDYFSWILKWLVLFLLELLVNILLSVITGDLSL